MEIITAAALKNGLENEGKAVMGPSDRRVPLRFSQSSLAGCGCDWVKDVVMKISLKPTSVYLVAIIRRKN